MLRVRKHKGFSPLAPQGNVVYINAIMLMNNITQGSYGDKALCSEPLIYVCMIMPVLCCKYLTCIINKYASGNKLHYKWWKAYGTVCSIHLSVTLSVQMLYPGAVSLEWMDRLTFGKM
jgi:hypothetical protein